mmetsp:Transcript_10775/g.16536  ORF Transcript_10775/g.16536 Transcript_10775/m.16536 type:complete len:355 (-) Transcript_10775:121-1185(-)
MIPMDKFLSEKRNLFRNHTSHHEFILPPNNRTDWNGVSKTKIHELHKWLRDIGSTPTWPSGDCVVGFDKLHQKTLTEVKIIPSGITNKAIDVNSTAELRLSEILAHRSQLCLYDEKWQKEKIIHFRGDIASGNRLLIHFYAYLFFADWKMDLWMKRFVRDNLRYADEIQCAAARVVEEIRRKAPSGVFDSFHIRRNDFRHKKLILSAEKIYSNVERVMTANSTIYIATDERNRSYFETFRKRHHQIFFLSDFNHLLVDLNTNLHGMVEQLILARSRVFVGCLSSTFSSFVNRLRGYYSTRDRLPGSETGSLPNSYYYAPLLSRRIMHTFTSFTKPIHSREFPVAWRNIDFDLKH